MSGVWVAERPCFICGAAIPLESFSQWSGAGSAYALCGQCGAPNEQQDTAFVVLDQAEKSEAPTPVMDVFPVIGGGWRACCDCGQTEAADTQAAGWSWVLDHPCVPRPGRVVG